MVRSGALLSIDGKARMSQLCERQVYSPFGLLLFRCNDVFILSHTMMPIFHQAELHTRFGQNVLHHENAYRLVLDLSELDGLPQSLIDSAAEVCRVEGL